MEGAGDEVPSTQTCVICRDILWCPVTLPCCNPTSVCQHCMKGWTENSNQSHLACPNCNKVLAARKTRRGTSSGMLEVDERRWVMLQTQYTAYVARRAKDDDLEMPPVAARSSESPPFR